MSDSFNAGLTTILKYILLNVLFPLALNMTRLPSNTSIESLYMFLQISRGIWEFHIQLYWWHSRYDWPVPAWVRVTIKDNSCRAYQRTILQFLNPPTPPSGESLQTERHVRPEYMKKTSLSESVVLTGWERWRPELNYWQHMPIFMVS